MADKTYNVPNSDKGKLAACGLRMFIIDATVLNAARLTQQQLYFLLRQLFADSRHQVRHFRDADEAASGDVIETEHLVEVFGLLARRFGDALTDVAHQLLQVHLRTCHEHHGTIWRADAILVYDVT